MTSILDSLSKITDHPNNIKGIIKTILVQAGDLIISHRMQFDNIAEKEKNEIITPADIAANNFIVKALELHYPKIKIYSEEGNDNKSSSTTRWIIDPIDGTTPWVWGNSGFSISLALEHKNKIILAAVYDPVMKELYFAIRNMGATRNDVPIFVSSSNKLNEMLMVVDWGNNDEKRSEGLKYFTSFFIPNMYARRIVPQFAPALGLCRIAEGRIHALVCNDTWLEDQSAGALILQEAGGIVSNFYHTKHYSHREYGIIACNNQNTHKKLVKFLVKSLSSINQQKGE